jgi:hypothetical protein
MPSQALLDLQRAATALTAAADAAGPLAEAAGAALGDPGLGPAFARATALAADRLRAALRAAEAADAELDRELREDAGARADRDAAVEAARAEIVRARALLAAGWPEAVTAPLGLRGGVPREPAALIAAARSWAHGARALPPAEGDALVIDPTAVARTLDAAADALRAAAEALAAEAEETREARAQQRALLDAAADRRRDLGALLRAFAGMAGEAHRDARVEAALAAEG